MTASRQMGQDVYTVHNATSEYSPIRSIGLTLVTSCPVPISHLYIKHCQSAHLMKVFAATSTIATKVNVREKAPKEMSICFRSVLFYKLKPHFSHQLQHQFSKTSVLILTGCWHAQFRTDHKSIHTQFLRHY